MRITWTLSIGLFSLTTATLGCSSSGSDAGDVAPGSGGELARAASGRVMALSNMFGVPAVSGYSNDGALDELVEDFYRDLDDVSCASVTMTDNTISLDLQDCSADGIAVDGTLTVAYEMNAHCNNELCTADAAIAFDSDVVMDGIAISGSWGASIHVDESGIASGEVSGSFHASADGVSSDIDFAGTFGDIECHVDLSYSDSTGNSADASYDC